MKPRQLQGQIFKYVDDSIVKEISFIKVYAKKKCSAIVVGN